MKAPEGWPFESWIDIDELKEHSSALGLPIDQLTTRYLSGPLGEFFDNVWPGKPESDRFLRGLTDNAVLGARVARAKPPAKYAVALEAGSWLQLLLVLTRILTDPRNLPDQADKPLPSLNERYALILLSHQELVPRFGGKETSPNVDLGSKRNTCLNQIAFYGGMFLTLHEAGHIADRHLDYWLELKTKSDLESANHRTSMEYLADKWALTAGTTLLRHYDAEHYTLFGFAVAISLLVIDQLRPNTPRAGDLYPMASDRLLLMEAVASAASKREPKNGQLVEGIREARASWLRMGWSYGEPTLRFASIDGFIDKLEELDIALATYRSNDR